ncbi:MAG: hypothetical protein PUD73_01495, partial [bacterium]|nr:hypothetical protein [bacterium]
DFEVAAVFSDGSTEETVSATITVDGIVTLTDTVADENSSEADEGAGESAEESDSSEQPRPLRNETPEPLSSICPSNGRFPFWIPRFPDTLYPINRTLSLFEIPDFGHLFFCDVSDSRTRFFV